MSTPTPPGFVLNLLTDPDAREAFELDPEGVLHGAGLCDITEADVRDSTTTSASPRNAAVCWDTCTDMTAPAFAPAGPGRLGLLDHAIGTPARPGCSTRSCA